jgi:hypothetical protein
MWHVNKTGRDIVGMNLSFVGAVGAVGWSGVYDDFHRSVCKVRDGDLP